MKLCFPESQIRPLAEQYDGDLKDRDKRLEEEITKIFPSYQSKGYLTKEEFLTVCAWKTPRSQSRCKSNDEAFVRDVSALALATESEYLRIQVWTLLAGVGWPTASVFLHFAFPDKYPILDYRALESLETKVPTRYTFPFWQDYTAYCRALARRTGVTMRTLDKALWKHSQLNQEK